MRLRILHQTDYHFDTPLPYGLQQLRLTPKSRPAQIVKFWSTEVEGGHMMVEFEDQHANAVTLVSLEEGRQAFTIRSQGEVETIDTHGVLGPHYGFAPLWYFLRHTPLTKPGPQLRELARSADEGAPIARLHTLSTAVLEHMPYTPGETHPQTTAEDALQDGLGVCQDHAHVFVTAARLMGHPARYVSGYLMMNDRVTQEAGHAWAEVHVDDVGWVGFDVSNGISPDERYIRVATGLDYSEAAPVHGLSFGTKQDSLKVSVEVQQQ